MRSLATAVLAAATLGPVLLGCTKSDEQPKTVAATSPAPARGQAGPTVVFTTGDGRQATVAVEVARTPADQQRGLMFRKQMGWDDGMLFLFDRDEQQTFWMKNTYIPLDMIFVRSDMTVLGVVENAEPLTTSPRMVPGLSRYVVEVNAGWAHEKGVGPGTKVRFDGV